MILGILPLLLQYIPATSLPSQPPPPVWSPDHRILATVAAPERFVTPAGGTNRLLLNDQRVYPPKKRAWFAGYDHVHTFLSPLVWSPDSRHVAFLEKVFAWEYTDPFNYDFGGTLKSQKFYLTIVSSGDKARSYRLSAAPPVDAAPHWVDDATISVEDRTVNLKTNPPPQIH